MKFADAESLFWRKETIRLQPHKKYKKMAKNVQKNEKFAVMRWLTDGNRISVHNLKYVTEPKLPKEEYKPGICGLSVFVGFPGLWKFRILNVGGKLI